MAKKDAVDKSTVQKSETAETCAGCGGDINLLQPHLQAMVKPRRAVFETVDSALLNAETDEEGNITKLAIDVTADGNGYDEDRFTQYMGYKLGAGDLVVLHNYECLSEYAQDKISDNQTEDGAPIIRALREDPVVYGEAE
jgi:hypothetical protein